MHTVMLAEVAGWHPTQKYCVVSFCAKPMGEILVFCHSGMYLSDIVLHSCKQKYKMGFFLPFPFFFFFPKGVKKEVQKDRDANRPVVSSPKRSAVTTTRLHSPGNYEPKPTAQGRFKLVDFASLVNTLSGDLLLSEDWLCPRFIKPALSTAGFIIPMHELNRLLFSLLQPRSHLSVKTKSCCYYIFKVTGTFMFIITIFFSNKRTDRYSEIKDTSDTWNERILYIAWGLLLLFAEVLNFLGCFCAGLEKGLSIEITFRVLLGHCQLSPQHCVQTHGFSISEEYLCLFTKMKGISFYLCFLRVHQQMYKVPKGFSKAGLWLITLLKCVGMVPMISLCLQFISCSVASFFRLYLNTSNVISTAIWCLSCYYYGGQNPMFLHLMVK